jgi:hypothetical protein
MALVVFYACCADAFNLHWWSPVRWFRSDVFRQLFEWSFWVSFIVMTGLLLKEGRYGEVVAALAFGVGVVLFLRHLERQP